MMVNGCIRGMGTNDDNNQYTHLGLEDAVDEMNRIPDISMQKIQSIDFGDKKSANENL